jgi:hypothetical protein
LHSCEELRSRRGLQTDRRISLDILFTIDAIIRDRAHGEVDIVTNNPGPPGCSQKLRERAVPGLVCPQRRAKRGRNKGQKFMAQYQHVPINKQTYPMLQIRDRAANLSILQIRPGDVRDDERALCPMFP